MAKQEKRGRKTIMTPEVVAKLEEAFSWGCTDIEACLHADIGTSTLYNYQDRHPEFVERKEALKETPILRARKSVFDRLPRDAKLSMDYLSRKKKDEFSTQTNHDLTTNGKDLPTPILGGVGQKDGDATTTD